MRSKYVTYLLADVIDLIGGGTPNTNIPEYWDGDIHWLSVKDFNNDERYVFSTEKSITKAGLDNSSTKMLNNDDIIISARGTVGELAMVPFPMAFNQSCYGIRGKKDIIVQTYLYYLLKDSIRLLKSHTHGSVFDTITRDTFARIEVNLPSIDEQHIIADILIALDDRISVNKAINHHLALPRSATESSPDIKRGKRVSRRVVKLRFSSRLCSIAENIGATIATKSVRTDIVGITIG